MDTVRGDYSDIQFGNGWCKIKSRHTDKKWKYTYCHECIGRSECWNAPKEGDHVGSTNLPIGKHGTPRNQFVLS